MDDLRVRAIAKSEGLKKFTLAKKNKANQPLDYSRCYFSNVDLKESGWFKTPIYLLKKLCAGQFFHGPTILIEDNSTILVEPGCTAEITEYGDVVIKVESETFLLNFYLKFIFYSLFNFQFV